jgi:transposase
MIIRQLKLKLNKVQEKKFENWLWCLTGVFNWAIRKIELDTRDGVYYSAFNFQNLLAGHSKKLGIPSHVIQGICCQAYTAWQRCFKKQARRPRFKGKRNPLNSIPFPDRVKYPKNNCVSILGCGSLRYHEQDLPDGVIKCGRIVNKPSGWYLYIWIDTVHSFPVKNTTEAVGIDPGFSTLLTLSNGVRFENPRELCKGAVRLTQAQRSGNKQLTARLQERQANRRRDRNHKISRKLIENYKTIYYSDDNFRGLAKLNGKSISEASLGQLIGMMAYKAVPVVRNVVPVNSKYTTMTCSACGALTGPTGLSGLAVRQWNCACGAQHDRDINAACNVLFAGVGCTLKESNELN